MDAGGRSCRVSGSGGDLVRDWVWYLADVAKTNGADGSDNHWVCGIRVVIREVRYLGLSICDGTDDVAFTGAARDDRAAGSADFVFCASVDDFAENRTAVSGSGDDGGAGDVSIDNPHIL